MDDYCDRDPEGKEEPYDYLALFMSIGIGVVGVMIIMIVGFTVFT